MSKKFIKSHVVLKPLEKKEKLISFIENELREEDVKKVVSLIKERGIGHRVSRLSYSEDGLLSVQLETGVTFGN